MKKKIGISLLALLSIAIIGLVIFMHKAKHGFASYETDIPEIEIPADKYTVLLFSKTTAFRHGGAIDASKESFQDLAEKKGWFLYETEEGGVFNDDQLSQFDVVVWNNSTGPVLNEAQTSSFQNYISKGGGYVGIHGAGDFSHNKWSWYTKELIGAEFSHHPIKNHIQKADVYRTEWVDSTLLTPPVWSHNDEWYVFHNNPRDRGAQILHYIDGTSIDPDGNLLWMTGMNFGMGKEHPVAWIKEVERGRAFYTSMGHSAEVFENKNFMTMIEKGIEWAGTSPK